MKNLFFAAMCCLPLFTKAQWSVNMKGPVNWYEVAPTGNLVLGAEGGVLGIDETDGHVLYTIPDFPSTSDENFEMIPNTPFGMVSVQDGRLESKLIFNVRSGAVVFNSKQEKISIAKQYILGNTGDFLFQGLRGSEAVFLLVDAGSGKVRWELKNTFGKGMFTEVLDGNPIETADGKFIIPTTGGMKGGGIYCFNTSDGSLVWKAELPKTKGAQTTTVTDTKLATSFLEKDKFIFMKGQSIMAYDIAGGKQLWSDAAKQRGLPDIVIYDPEGLIISSAVDPNNTIFKPTMAMYDYATGKEIWAEQVKLKGSVRNYSYCDKGLLISMEDARGTSLLNIVDLEKGIYVFENHCKVNGSVQELRLMGQNVYVRTQIEEDIINLDNNKTVFEKNLSSKVDKPLLNVRNGEASYTFNPSNEFLYFTDLAKSGQRVLVSEKINFDGNEVPTKIEVLNNMIVLSSSQNVQAFDFNGKSLYKSYIPAPGIAGWKKALLATSAVLNTMDAMRYAELEGKAREAERNAKTPQGREICNAFAQLGNRGANMHLSAASREMDMIKKRYKASASGNDVQFVLSKLESKDFALLGISKLDGKTIKEINFGKDKEPRYLLDDVSRTVYYLSPGKELKAVRY